MTPADNALLAALPDEVRERLALEPAPLPLSRVLYRAGAPVDWVWWVGDGLLSVVAPAEGKQVETSMVGREGAAGLAEACGGGVSYLTVLVEIEGHGWRSPAAACLRLFEDSADFRRVVMAYTGVMLAEGRQSVICQAAHAAEARCARWLLESADRSGVGARVPLTHEYLAAMLGVQRTTVTAIAGALERRGLLRQHRGVFELTDPEGLEAAACPCRRLLKAHRETGRAPGPDRPH